MGSGGLLVLVRDGQLRVDGFAQGLARLEVRHQLLGDQHLLAAARVALSCRYGYWSGQLVRRFAVKEGQARASRQRSRDRATEHAHQMPLERLEAASGRPLGLPEWLQPFDQAARPALQAGRELEGLVGVRGPILVADHEGTDLAGESVMRVP